MRAKDLTKLVRVSPPVEDLFVWSYGESLFVRGDFERSKTYDIGLAGLVDRYGSRLAKPFHATSGLFLGNPKLAGRHRRTGNSHKAERNDQGARKR
jgi:hypothetical protein